MAPRSLRPSRDGANAAIASGDSRPEATCFSDEVVIDFPSVAPALDRIRNAFLAEDRAAALKTAIQLSPHEAAFGATVPLEVPVRCTCRVCGGRGETWTEPCPGCHGSGAVLMRHRVQVSVPAGVLDGASFQFSVTPRHHLPTRVELRVLVV
jgi:DnaJ-class molecular chaperone